MRLWHNELDVHRQIARRVSGSYVILSGQILFALPDAVKVGNTFFFSSRSRHTRCLSDWSSDVCSSDLWAATKRSRRPTTTSATIRKTTRCWPVRSEERRVGKGCRSRWSPYHYKKNTPPALRRTWAHVPHVSDGSLRLHAIPR